MAGVFGPPHNLSRRRIFRSPQGLIEHLPENRFIRGGEWVNHVIHNLKGSRLILIAPDYAKNSPESQAASAARKRSPRSTCCGQGKVSDLFQTAAMTGTAAAGSFRCVLKRSSTKPAQSQRML